MSKTTPGEPSARGDQSSGSEPASLPEGQDLLVSGPEAVARPEAREEPTYAELVSLLRADQCHHWQHGDRVLAEVYLAAHPELHTHPPAAVDLIYCEYLLRLERGETPSAEEYLQRFPQYHLPLQRQLDLHQALESTPHLPGEQNEQRRDTPRQPGEGSEGKDLTWPSLPHYDILEELGRGGMGVVYKARQLRPQRLVALKMIRDQDYADTEQLARFHNEPELLARLQHPHIVQIHEVGTHDGQPYFSLEYVDGGSLAQKLAGQPMPPRAAAELVHTLACAVHAAHRCEVVHRDLKPANVLLTADGTPKITDFGLAKRLDVESGQTQTGAIMGTPSYMAPEQATGKSKEIGPRSDVYALGAILYEMLTGRPPFQGTSALETLLQVRSEGPPVSPRSLQPTVPRDLETICLKCLEKEARKRYATAAELAEDLRRFLVGEPILAHPPSAAYQFWKLLRRHRGPVLAASAVVLALLAGLAGTTWGLVRAETRRVEAEQAKEQTQKHLAQVEKANEILGSIFDNLDPDAEERGDKPLGAILAEQLDQAAQHLEGETVSDPLVVARLQNRLGRALHGLGRADKAVVLYARARETRSARLGPDHPDTLISMNNLAEAYRAAGNLRLALPLHEETLRLRKAGLGPNHSHTLISMNNLAAGYHAADRLDLALPLYKEALQRRRARLDPDHPDTLVSMSNLANGYRAAGEFSLALPLYQETLTLMKAKLGSNHSTTLRTMNSLAACHQDAGEFALALPLYQETLTLKRAKLGPEHSSTLRSMSNLASGYHASGQLALALPLFEETLKLMKTRLGPDHPDTLTNMNNLASGYHASGQLALALPLFEETLKRRRAKLGPDHSDTFITMNDLALAYSTVGKHTLALSLFEETLKLQRTKLGPDHPHTLTTLGNLAFSYIVAGKLDLALPLSEETLTLRKAKLGSDHPGTLNSMNTLASCYRAAGKLDLAVPLFEETLELRKARLGLDHPNTLNSMRNLGSVYLTAKQPEKAVPLLKMFLVGQKKQLDPENPRLAGVQASVAHELLQHQQFAPAESILRECLAIRAKHEPDAWRTFHTQSLLGGALLGQQKYADAEPLLLQGYEGMKQQAAKIPKQGQVLLTEALERLVQLYSAWGKSDEAARWFKELEAAKTAPK